MGKVTALANTSELAEGAMKKYKIQDQEIRLLKSKGNTMLTRINAHTLVETYLRENWRETLSPALDMALSSI